MQLVGTLTPRAPYDFALSARLMSRYHGVLDHYDARGYWRAIHSPHSTTPTLIHIPAPTDTPTLNIYRVRGDAPAAYILQTTAHLLALTDDFAPFYALAEAHPSMARIVRALYGLHHFQSQTVFEALCMVIIEQQISLYGALKAQHALAVWGGQGVEYEGKTYYAFPSAAQIAHADPQTLQAQLKITHRRTHLMQSVAQAITGGTLDLEALHNHTDAGRYAALMAIKGVGHWTAAWTLIRGLGGWRYAGHNDVALRDAVSAYFAGQSTRVSPQEVAQMFAEFAPYDGLAAFYTLMHWAVEHY